MRLSPKLFLTAVRIMLLSAVIALVGSLQAETVGCGAGTGGANTFDQSTCGNHAGAPYEDLATGSGTTPPSPFGSGTLHSISSCTTIVPTTGDVWRFSGNIDDGVSGTNQNCIYFRGQNANDFAIDLAGYTLTGGIHCDQSAGGHDCSGITIVNGTINCNIANGGSEGCIYLNQSGNPSKSILLSHLTVNNQNSPSDPDGTYSGFEFAVIIVANGSAMMSTVPAGADQKTFNGAGVELAHLTVTNAAGYSGSGYTTGWCARCTDIQVDSAGGTTVEAWNNTINNGDYVDADQGIVCFNTGPCSMHNNYAPWVQYRGVQDTGRPFLFDAAGKPFNQNGGQAFSNYVIAYNNRCVRTRQVNNVLVHDNLFSNVQSTTIDPCIMMGGNGDYAEKINGNLVSDNTFLMAGGTAIEAAESYGLVADSNTFDCDSSCSSGILAAAWLAEGSNGLTYAINSASRTSGCVVTLNLAAGPSTTSVLADSVYVNVSGRTDSFNVSGTAGNLVTSVSGTTITYTQAGCAGAASGGSGGTFWMVQSSTDNFAADGAEIYVKNSTVDPLLTMTTPFLACGTASPACQNPPQTTQNGGQTQIQYCNNSGIAAVGGTGTLVTHRTPDPGCP